MDKPTDKSQEENIKVLGVASAAQKYGKLLYLDPNHPLALYTYSNIPSQAIKFCGTIETANKKEDKDDQQ